MSSELTEVFDLVLADSKVMRIGMEGIGSLTASSKERATERKTAEKRQELTFRSALNYQDLHFL